MPAPVTSVIGPVREHAANTISQTIPETADSATSAPGCGGRLQCVCGRGGEAANPETGRGEMTFRKRKKGNIEAGLRRMMRTVRSLLVIAVAGGFVSCAGAEPPTGTELPSLSRTVIVVRHAEKSSHPEKDPGLTSAGLERAALLADLLERRDVDLIITSELRRSRETAADVAARSGLQPRVVPVNAPGGLDAHIRAIVTLVAKLAPGTTTLVVGHSFTISPLLEAFGVSGEDGLCAETDYSKMWIVTIAGDGSATVARSDYGSSNTPVPTRDGRRLSSEETR